MAKYLIKISKRLFQNWRINLKDLFIGMIKHSKKIYLQNGTKNENADTE